MFTVQYLEKLSDLNQNGYTAKIQKEISAGQKCLMFTLRSEHHTQQLSYSREVEIAIAFMKIVFEEFSSKVFLVYAANSIGSPSRVRSYKGAFWDVLEFKKQPKIESEIKVYGSETRFFGVVDATNTQRVFVENMGHFYILSNAELDDFVTDLSDWADDKGGFFNYKSILRSLAKIPDTTLVRYQFSYNGVPERLYLIGNNPHLSWKAEKILAKFNAYYRSLTD